MAVFQAYRERVRGISDTLQRTDSRLKHVGGRLFALLAAIETEPWRSFPVVDSPEVMWHQGREELEHELEELLHESKPIS